ncbi:calcium uniporter protein 2, mitochondrial-like isoform X2 [Asparagus officinalis]|uniref:calcium uniporter protein 2, mitochondrial-like isoform X2 n=1 Tax=Asparagus officinalis TaxID=4686 RepID=UPI00098E5807|nr:calcium uniporter protein 2, mitochondrial-like isoform X2 [Asparagus officinalis]
MSCFFGPMREETKGYVFEMVAKAVESVIPLSIPQHNPLSIPQQKNQCQKEELRELEEQKAAIDKLAETGVKRELWCGLGFMLIQTIGLMRLTFWELSWDVMEPICFYLTSMYFLAGYGFFLRTSREPSFESFFQSRFDAKQKKLMKAYSFDLNRFNELKKGCAASLASFPSEGCASSFCDCRAKGMQVAF